MPITQLDDAESINDTDQSISDVSDVEAEGTELNPPVEPEKVEGKVTGITVLTDNALTKKSAKWKKKTISSAVTTVDFLNRNKDMKTYAMKRALQIQDAGDIVFRSISANADVSTDSYLTTQEDYLDPIFRCGWAKRPKVGQMYGTKYVEDYRSDIKSLYNSGEADKKNKKSPAQMLEILESRYPNEFCLPSENDIRTEINKLQTQKKSAARDNRPRGSKDDDEQTNFIKELALSNPSLKPTAAVAALKARFAVVTLTDAQIKNKFSYYKAKANKNT